MYTYVHAIVPPMKKHLPTLLCTVQAELGECTIIICSYMCLYVHVRIQYNNYRG